MVLSRVKVGVLALALPALVLVPILVTEVAFGEPPARPARSARSNDKGDRHDPDNVKAISLYMETLAKGNERFVTQDRAGAIEAYNEAIAISPNETLGYYLLGEAHLAANDLAAAETAIQKAYALDTKDQVVRAHVLFVRALLLERQKKLDEAKAAWQTYVELAARSDGGTFSSSGAERVRAIQKVTDLERAYVAVRERIAAEKSDAGKPSAKP